MLRSNITCSAHCMLPHTTGEYLASSTGDCPVIRHVLLFFPPLNCTLRSSMCKESMFLHVHVVVSERDHWLVSRPCRCEPWLCESWLAWGVHVHPSYFPCRMYVLILSSLLLLYVCVMLIWQCCVMWSNVDVCSSCLLPPDTSLTPHTLLHALSTVKNVWDQPTTDGVLYRLGVPISVENQIRSSPSYSSEDEKRTAALQYTLQTLPGVSWGRIAGVLWCLGEHTALETVRQYLPHKPGDYITCTILYWLYI